MAKALGDGEHTDQHGYHTGTPKTDARDRSSALRYRPEAELRDGSELREPIERAGHDYILRSASAMRSLIAWSAGRIPVARPNATTSAIPSRISPVGKKNIGSAPLVGSPIEIKNQASPNPTEAAQRGQKAGFSQDQPQAPGRWQSPAL